MVSLITIMKRNFVSGLDMLGGIIDGCPDDLWPAVHGWFPFWQQIYHVLECVDFWFRETYARVYDETSLKVWSTDKNVSPELDETVTEFADFLSRAELKDYLNRIRQKSDRFFDNLSDLQLALPVAENDDDFTYLDVIEMQMRHVMYHVGHCNCILRSHAGVEIGWISHNER